MTHPARIVRWTTVAVGLVYGAALYFSGLKLDADLKHILAYLPAILSLAVVAFDRWIWKWPLICHFHNRPLVHGLWRTELRPDKDSHIPEGGNWGPISGYLVVEQSYWSIALTQFTAESASYSKASSFLKHKDSDKQMLVYVYDNQPKRAHLSRSARHIGGCELEVASGSPTTMSGSYFTDRFTAGGMELRLVDRTTNYVDFSQADAHGQQSA
jgi:hypothetical protein